MKLEITFDFNLKWLRVAITFLVLAVLLPAFRASESYAAPYATELIGNSLQGRPIVSYRFGQGATHIAFIGGMHQGYESNSTDLILKAIAYYTEKPNEIPAAFTVYFIPNANPDGKELNQRTNARGVDLNRNWPTQDWKSDTYDIDGAVKGGGGAKPLSEPETDALWKYIQANDIIATMFYHARGGNVVDTLPTAAGKRYSTVLARTLAASTGYTYLDIWGYYDVSGDASDFLNSKGIYSLTVELYSYSDPDWSQNLRGFQAVMSFFTPRVFENGHSLSGRLLAFWNSNGGQKAMGLPTAEPQEQGTRLWQQFERGTLTLDRKTGLVAWKEQGNGPVDVPATGPVPTRPAGGLKLVGIPVPRQNKVQAADSQSSQLRDKINQLQQDAHDLEQEFFKLNQKLGQGSLAAPVIPAVTVPAAGTAEKEIKVVLNINSIATIFAYEKGKLVRTIGAFSGKTGYDTPKGEFKVNLKMPLLKTNRWYEDDGTEYYLNNFMSFTNAALAATGTPDDWGFHQMRIPVSGPDAGQMQTGPSHGCLALSPADAEWLYNWSPPGTPVSIN